MERRIYRKAECSYCKEHKFVAAHGLCRACYQRQRKTGDLEKRERTRAMCSIEGCGHIAVGGGYCEMHYRRWKAHGDPLTDTRPKDWGAREEHPLYGTWNTRRRQSFKGVMDECWRESFWKFAEDVGERPSQNHFLRLIDKSGTWGPGNTHWVEKIPANPNTDDHKAKAKTRAALDRLANPMKHLGYALKKNFGITLDTYLELSEKQNNRCAICGKESNILNPAHVHGKPQRLAVDHCHGTGKVRGLLCHHCNAGIGNFGDNIELLQSAIEYLRKS